MTDPDPHRTHPEEREKAEEAAAGSGSFIEDKVVPLIAEPTLGPLWAVVIAHLAAFGAWALLIALEQGRLSAWLGVFGLFWLTGTAGWAEIRQRGRPGALSLLVVILWATTLGFAFAARYWGIF